MYVFVDTAVKGQDASKETHYTEMTNVSVYAIQGQNVSKNATVCGAIHKEGERERAAIL